MKLFIRNRTVAVRCASPKEVRWLSKVLSVPVPGAQYTPAYKNNFWDGTKKFFNAKLGTFPTGLLPTVLESSREARKRIRVRTYDKRESPFQRVLRINVETWSDYLRTVGLEPQEDQCDIQVEGVHRILTNRVADFRWPRGIVQLPPGTGKTILGSALLHTLKRPRTLMVCNRVDLLTQTQEVLSRVLDEPIGKVGGGSHSTENITVATVQSFNTRNRCKACNRTFSRKKARCSYCNKNQYSVEWTQPHFGEWVSGVDVLIIDECHKVGENEYANLVKQVPAYVRIGLSATPLLRGDVGDVSLVGATGDVLYRKRSSDLARSGVLATTTVELIRSKSPTINTKPIRHRSEKVRRRMASSRFRQVYQSGIVEEVERNNQIVDLAMQDERPTIILVKYIKHGEILRDMFRELHSYDVPYLHGADTPTSRKELIERFKSGEESLFIASTIFDEAMDLPNIRVVILAGGGNSVIKTIQRIGRGMRRKEGDNSLTVYDFIDDHHRLLLRNSEQRASTYKQQGYTCSRTAGT